MKQGGSAAEVLRAFLFLGVSSFGGPVAHLGYFRRTFVERLNWLSEADYAALLSLCQFLPGPASSQMGFCIGLQRAGWLGGLAAWVGFTLPSALLMLAFAFAAGGFEASQTAQHIMHGLQLAAIAVVAQAVWVMSRALCPDLPRRLMAILGLVIISLFPGAAGQIMVLVIGATVGTAALTAPPPAAQPEPPTGLSRRAATACLSIFAALLTLSLLPFASNNLALAAAFYRTGALVFGGGHVVLPLLRVAIVEPGWVPLHSFLAGYGAAQAMPGPLFTVAAFLGATAFNGAGGLTGGCIALAAIFLPGLLLAAGVLPFWHHLRRQPGLDTALMGINAAVVGLLGFALLSLITSGSIHNPYDAAIVLIAILALTLRNTPPIIVVALCTAAALI